MRHLKHLAILIMSAFLMMPHAARAGSLYSCENLFGEKSIRQETKAIAIALKDNRGTSDEATVRWIDHSSDQKVIFLKKRSDLWLSRHIALEDTLTAEGDLRLPMFLMGPELAAKMGYSIREYQDDRVEVAVPGTALLEKNLKAANVKLKSRGLDPVTYLPVHTGYISVEDGINLLLSADGDFLVYFPYADDFAELVPHEAAFHIGAVMLPKKVNERTRVLTQETLGFVNLLKENKAKFGSKTDTLVAQILLERSFELDAGLASNVTTPAHARRDNEMKSYREIFSKIKPKSWYYMERSMEYLNRPTLQPPEAVLARLEVMTGIDLSDLIKGDKSHFMVRKIASHGIGDEVSLDAREKKVLREIVLKYLALPHPELSLTTPHELAEEYILGLDQRILDLTHAL